MYLSGHLPCVVGLSEYQDKEECEERHVHPSRLHPTAQFPHTGPHLRGAAAGLQSSVQFLPEEHSVPGLHTQQTSNSYHVLMYDSCMYWGITFKTLFQDRDLGERRLNSAILGSSVANLTITGLQDDVVIHLRNIEPVPVSQFSHTKDRRVTRQSVTFTALTLKSWLTLD